MAFEGLSEKLVSILKKLKSKGKLSENDVKEAMREVRLALLEADVNYEVAKDFTKNVTELCVGADIMESLTPSQMVVKIVNEELTRLMGGEQARIQIAPKSPTVILLCGLQGAGKTTYTAKLAYMLKKQGHHPMLVACDIYRPAAIKQLQVVGEKAGVTVFAMGKNKPTEICKAALKQAQDYGNDFVLIDTAGRLQIDEVLMDELKDIKKLTNPSEILLIVDSMIGQEAVHVAKAFDKILNITGVILTKLDGDTRGGAALSIRAMTGKPIKFIGVSEKIEDLEIFHPDRMTARILGMGDILSLVEEVQSKIDKKAAEQAAKKMIQNKMDLNNLLQQIEQVKNMGPLKSVLAKFPGMGQHLKDVDVDDRQLNRTVAIIYSMTLREREKPSLINPSRKHRIAAGSGMRVADVNHLLNQFDQMQKMFKRLKGRKGRKRISNLPL